MFKELAPLLRQRAVALTVSHLEDDQLRVTVIPQKIKEGENTALLTPVMVTGTPEQLDQELPSTLVNFVGAHLQLKSTLERAQAEMTAAGNAAKTAARSKSKTQASQAPEKPTPSMPASRVEVAHEASEPALQTGSLFDLAPAEAPASSPAENEAEILAEIGGQDSEHDDELDDEQGDDQDVPAIEPAA
jgi:PRTRC genetic system protein E